MWGKEAERGAEQRGQADGFRMTHSTGAHGSSTAPGLIITTARIKTALAWKERSPQRCCLSAQLCQTLRKALPSCHLASSPNDRVSGVDPRAWAGEGLPKARGRAASQRCGGPRSTLPPHPWVVQHRQSLLRVPAQTVTATTVYIKEKPGEWLLPLDSGFGVLKRPSVRRKRQSAPRPGRREGEGVQGAIRSPSQVTPSTSLSW